MAWDSTMPAPEGFAASSLRDLVRVLASPAGVRMFKKAYRQNMLHKVWRYGELLARSLHDVDAALEVIRLKVPDLKAAACIDAAETADNWHIFESISGPYLRAKDQASQFQAIIHRANAVENVSK